MSEPTYEHHVLTVPAGAFGNVPAILDEQSRQGWELVSVLSSVVKRSPLAQPEPGLLLFVRRRIRVEDPANLLDDAHD